MEIVGRQLSNHFEHKISLFLHFFFWFACLHGLPSYTERQKKLITSSERHSLKSKASKWIIFGHRLAIFIFILAHLKNKTKVCCTQQGEICGEIARGQFSKITETAGLPGWEFSADGYGLHNPPLRVFAISEKLPFVISSHFSPFWHKQTFVFSGILIKGVLKLNCVQIWLILMG